MKEINEMEHAQKLIDAMKNASLESVIEHIKESLVYPAYEKAVKNGEKNTVSGLLQPAYLLDCMFSDENRMELEKVAHDVLFSLIDQKLRAEIMEGKE